MDDFSPEGNEAVIDSMQNNASPDRRIVKRPNRGVVGKKNSSMPARFLRGAAAGAALGLAVHGAADKVVGHVTAEEGDISSSSAVVAVAEGEENESRAELDGTHEETHAEKSLENRNSSSELFDIVFHDLSPEQYQEARVWVDDFKQRIAAKPGYEKEHRMIPQKYKEIIEQTAEAYGLPPEMLYGIIAIENGGGEDVTNEISGARGVAQFMVDTGEQYGLVDKEKGYDHRGDPVLSIDAAGRYLRDHKAMLGEDIGLTIWSYHAGIGNVNKALSVYFMDKYGEDIGFDDGNVDIAKAKALIARDKLDFCKLVTNEQVKIQVISTLHDYSDTYVPSVLALIELEHERTDQEFDLGDGLKVSVPKGTFTRE